MKMLKKVYNSISSFTDDIDRENNSIMYSQHSSTRRADNWNGNISYDQSIDMIKNGWNEGTKMLKKAKGSIKVPKSVTFQRKPYGFIPLVPMALINNPNSMLMRKEEKSRRIINMYIDIDNNCGISGEQIIKAGALALTYVDEVQKLGNVDINLYAVMTCKVRGESLTVAIKIKDAGKAYSLRRIAFPIAHPAMLRRLLFKHIETTDLISDPAWARGYGMAYDAKKANPEWFILPSAEKLTDTGYRLNSLEYETYAKYVNDYNSNTKL